ncbi:metal-dependent hydrolase [Balneolales bacterium ANBcel1]|nr:metal-dependent hydrolase [Balneolales bacterium ANBcel1]
MDPITHGLTGAAAAQLASDKEKQRPAALTGLVAAMLPDLETFIHHPADPLFNIEIHRQFTHALLFIPVGALLTAGLLWWLMRNHLSFRELFFFSLLGFATHGFMDAVTSYGTELLWPFSDTRVAWHLLPIVDPLLTIVMGVLAGAAFYYRKKRFAWLFFAWLAIYLLAGFIQRERGTAAMEAVAQQRGHTVERMVVKPTIGNLVLWRSTYQSGDSIHVDAVRSGFFAPPVVYPGDVTPLVTPSRHFSHMKGTVLYDDLRRFQRFSDGYLIFHPDDDQIIGDARYSMVPNELVPLWGIEADTTKPDRHVPFLYFRDTGEEVRNTFLEMVLGKKQP